MPSRAGFLCDIFKNLVPGTENGKLQGGGRNVWAPTTLVGPNVKSFESFEDLLLLRLVRHLLLEAMHLFLLDIDENKETGRNSSDCFHGP